MIWISVEEELPKQQHNVITYVIDPCDPRHKYVSISAWFGDRWFDHNAQWEVEVTHWMPLPENPSSSARAVSMNAVFEVKRIRQSATQGEAAVLFDGEMIEQFGDEIAIDGKHGDKIGNWGSVKPDIDFITAVLFPSEIHRKCYPEMVEKWEKKIRKILIGGNKNGIE